MSEARRFWAATPEHLLRRYRFIIDLARQTDSLLGDRALCLTHVDQPFLFFDPLSPSPWLTDEMQFSWGIHNHEQTRIHGHAGSLRRIFLFPSVPPRLSYVRQRYLAAAKATLHLQLYEGVRVGVCFVDAGRDYRRFNFCFAKFANSSLAWPAANYYGKMDLDEAALATGTYEREVEERLETLLGRTMWLAPYRPEHFEQHRIKLPKSWRRFLFRLQGGECASCNVPISRNEPEIDHTLPLTPYDDYLGRRGNSTLINLSAMCRLCNRLKANHQYELPEVLSSEMIQNGWSRKYFLNSVTLAPSVAQHDPFLFIE